MRFVLLTSIGLMMLQLFFISRFTGPLTGTLSPILLLLCRDYGLTYTKAVMPNLSNLRKCGIVAAVCQEEYIREQVKVENRMSFFIRETSAFTACDS